MMRTGIAPHDEAFLSLAMAAAKQAWPDVEVDLSAFRQHLEYCLAHIQEKSSPHASLQQMHISDLYLVYSVISGGKNGINRLEREYLSEIERHVPRHLGRQGLLADIAQEIRMKLLLHTAEKPSKLVAYYGQSPLGGWLATVVRRTASDLGRQKGAPSQALEAALWARDVVGGPQPERQLAKRDHQERLRDCLRQALAELPPAERVLLDRHFRAGHSLAQMATESGVHRSTLKRRVDGILDALRQRLESALRAEHRLTDSEFVSLMMALISQI